MEARIEKVESCATSVYVYFSDGTCKAYRGYSQMTDSEYARIHDFIFMQAKSGRTEGCWNIYE